MRASTRAQVIRVTTHRVHDWGPTCGAADVCVTSCERCGRTAFGSTHKWDLLSLLLPFWFGCQTAELIGGTDDGN